MPGLSWEIVRPKTILLRGYDIDGNEVEIEADEYAARVFQHEIDHLDGVLLLERLDKDTRKQALRTLRNLMLDGGLRRGDAEPPALGRRCASPTWARRRPRCRRCVRWSTPATTSPSSSPARTPRRGRGSALSPSPVKAAALELGLPVTDRVDDVLDLDPPAELGVVVAFGRIIKPHVLDARCRW